MSNVGADDLEEGRVIFPAGLRALHGADVFQRILIDAGLDN